MAAQFLLRPAHDAVEVVRALGTVQAQDYPGAKWALGQRVAGATDAAIESLFAVGAILRTHVLRPTWHFVAPEDIRWMLALTAPRVAATMASYNRKLELTADVFGRSNDILARALQGGRHLTRQELKDTLAREGIIASTQRLGHLMMQAELDAVICSGARRAAQLTYALLDDRVPAAPTLSRDAALAELARRYVASHGPAQLHDFVWWSGLTTADARAGLMMAGRDLASDIVKGRTYYVSASTPSLTRSRPAHLLPLYDEYLIAYKDRSAAFDVSRWTRTRSPDAFSAPVLVRGQVVGGWRRKLEVDRIVITLTPFSKVTSSAARAIARAACDYAAFLGLSLKLTWS